MRGAVLILRPQPGGDQTAERARARGLEPVVAPLFTVQPLEWSAPPAEGFDAILLTSANAARHAGPALAAFRHLRCYAVGEASAQAAAEAGFGDVRTGPSDGAAVVQIMAAEGVRRAFHPTSPEPASLGSAGVEIEQAAVYSAEPAERLSDVAVAALHAGAVVLLHSPRAGALFSELVGERRAQTRIAAISDAAVAAAGPGWAGVGVAVEPRDDALLAAAQELVEVGAPDLQPLPSIGPPPPALAPRPRSWLWPLLLALAAFLLGIAAMAWVLTRWDSVGQFLGLVPDPAAVAPGPEQVIPPQRQLVQPFAPATQSRNPVDGDVAQRVALLEQRLGQLGTEAQSAVGSTDRAEGLLVALAARRALDRGVGLGYLEGLLRQRFGESQPQAVETIIAASRQPVTLQTLQEELAKVGPELSGAPGQGFLRALSDELANLIVVRREGTPSTDPRERLRRAIARLEAGQVELALLEVGRLPGRENGRGWIDAAQRYVTARQAIDRIETAALLEPRMPAQQTGPAQPPAPAQPSAPQPQPPRR
ncbi:MAG TPA: uroporphyrinogen-III synthase [Allosphingosinicella sp.]|jgi:uroporphyrinogen-III synthase